MKRLLIFLTFFFLVLPSSVFAKETSGSDLHTIREEKEGKEIFEKLNKKEIICSRVSNEQFASLGEFFMGKMMGDSHDAMNAMMLKMMGEENEKQLHVVIGKRMSECNTNEQMPLDMMTMMMRGGGGLMMGGWGGSGMLNWGGFGLVGSLLWLVILIDLILLGVWIWKKINEK